MPLKDFLLKKGIDIDASKKSIINKIGVEAYNKERKENFFKLLKNKDKEHKQERGEDYSDSDSDSDDEEPVKKTRMKTMKIDNSKAIERRRKRDEIIEHDKKLTDKKTIQRVIDHVMKGVNEVIPKKRKGRLMTTIKIVEPVKKKIVKLENSKVKNKIVKLENSKVKNKRLRVILNNGDSYDFGLADGDTYIDEGDKVKRENYWARHLANPDEEYRIKNLVPSASLFSAYLLWGETTNLNQNVKILNKLFK